MTHWSLFPVIHQMLLKSKVTEMPQITVSDFQAQLELTTQECHCSQVKDNIFRIQLASPDKELITPPLFAACHHQCFWRTYQSHANTVPQGCPSRSHHDLVVTQMHSESQNHPLFYSMWDNLKNIFLITGNHAHSMFKNIIMFVGALKRLKLSWSFNKIFYLFQLKFLFNAVWLEPILFGFLSPD